jgi:hypothetical protein
MDRCPELFELEGFFETPYQSMYGNDEEGWYYDRVRFERDAGGARVICEMEPAEGMFSIYWSVNGEAKVNLSLQYVQSIDISVSAGEEHLIGHILHDGVDQMFKLAVKPTFSFVLGTGLPTW